MDRLGDLAGRTGWTGPRRGQTVRDQATADDQARLEGHRDRSGRLVDMGTARPRCPGVRAPRRHPPARRPDAGAPANRPARRIRLPGRPADDQHDQALPRHGGQRPEEQSRATRACPWRARLTFSGADSYWTLWSRTSPRTGSATDRCATLRRRSAQAIECCCTTLDLETICWWPWSKRSSVDR
ncbi:hypothetical protein MMEU_5252 [Mycobacterium marinum str. Europe]|nr:hypothetical protein MMEU_5252 [Mycobacterium marinum str. Europe]